MTFRFKARRLWIFHYSWLELALYAGSAVFAAVELRHWHWLAAVAAPVLCGLLAFHPVSISLGTPPVLQRYFAFVPLRRITLGSLEPSISADDFSGAPGDGDGIELEDHFVSCDRPAEVAGWIRANATAGDSSSK